MTYLYNVVIKQQPEAMTFHNGDVMPAVRTTGEKMKGRKSPGKHILLYDIPMINAITLMSSSITTTVAQTRVLLTTQRLEQKVKI